MLHFFILTKRKFLYFIFIVIAWNVLQEWMWNNCHRIFSQLNINNGNVPCYIPLSIEVLAKCFGRSAVYPPGQSWFQFAYGWVYIVVVLFWIMVWYAIACGIDSLQKYDQRK